MIYQNFTVTRGNALQFRLNFIDADSLPDNIYLGVKDKSSEAFNIALQGNANYGGGNTEVVLEIDGREFGRAVVEQGNRENRRIGTRLVIA